MLVQPNMIKPKPMRISPWKGPETFLKFLNLCKLSINNIETLSQRQNIEETFSLSRDMDVGSYFEWWKVTWRSRLFSGDMDNY